MNICVEQTLVYCQNLHYGCGLSLKKYVSASYVVSRGRFFNRARHGFGFFDGKNAAKNAIVVFIIVFHFSS